MKKLMALGALFALLVLAMVPTASAGGDKVFATVSLATVGPGDFHIGGGGALLVDTTARGGGGFSFVHGTNTGTFKFTGWTMTTVDSITFVDITVLIHTNKPKDIPDFVGSTGPIAVLDRPDRTQIDFSGDGVPDTTLLFFVRLAN